MLQDDEELDHLPFTDPRSSYEPIQSSGASIRTSSPGVSEESDNQRDKQNEKRQTR